jgi:hypothetical protein
MAYPPDNNAAFSADNPQSVVAAWLAEAGAAGGADCYAGKRNERRFPWTTQMELRAGGRVHYVNTTDISPEGIGVMTRIAMAEGETVWLRRGSADPWIKARVAHNTQTVGKYRVGMALHLDFELASDRGADGGDSTRAPRTRG